MTGKSRKIPEELQKIPERVTENSGRVPENSGKTTKIKTTEVNKCKHYEMQESDYLS
jgi:hypothetical protein